MPPTRTSQPRNTIIRHIASITNSAHRTPHHSTPTFSAVSTLNASAIYPSHHVRSQPPSTPLDISALERGDIPLDPFYFQRACQVLNFRPALDMFASPAHHLTEQWCGPSSSSCTDAFRLTWDPAQASCLIRRGVYCPKSYRSCFAILQPVFWSARGHQTPLGFNKLCRRSQTPFCYLQHAIVPTTTASYVHQHRGTQ